MLLVVLVFATACGPAERDDLAVRLDAVVAPLFAPHRSGGVVLVAMDDNVVFRRAYGMADVELEVAMQPDHVLGTGSITKQFTAAAVLKLVAQGRIALDDDVRTFLPDFNTHGHRITIDQLLSHTSGLPDFIDREDFEALSRTDHSVSEILALTRDVPLHFEPGQGFRYSNSGYILLGAVIEHVSGRSYAEYLEEQLFRPLGMHDTWYGDDTRIIPRRARGYALRNGRLVRAEYLSMTLPHAAGAVFSTVDDMVTWDVALRSGTVMPLDLLEAAWSPRILPDGTPSGYGYGWKLCAFAGRPIVFHGGFVNGYLANATRLPDDGILVVALVNNDSDAPDPSLIARRIIRYLVTGSTDIQPYNLSETERAALVGRYAIGPDDMLQIMERDSVLYRRRNAGDAQPLVALGPTQLTPAEEDVGWTLEFILGADGTAATVWMSLGCEPRFTARRIHTLDGEVGESSTAGQ